MKAYVSGGKREGRWKLFLGNAQEVLPEWKAGSVDCCVTSPPYWGLRDYGIEPSVWGGEAGCEHEWSTTRVQKEMRYGLGLKDSPASTRGGGHKAAKTPNVDIEMSTCSVCGAWRGALGLEPTPQLYIEHMVSIFEQVRRVLKPEGTCWLNIGDSYNAYNGGAGPSRSLSRGAQTTERPRLKSGYGLSCKTLKPKDLCLIPFRLAITLQEAGWYVRSDIIWAKPNPMPESVRDRPTRSHEYIFLLSKSPKYYYDKDAIAEDLVKGASGSRFDKGKTGVTQGSRVQQGYRDTVGKTGKKNRRSVWTIASKPFPEAHFAVFPPALPELCIKAGCPPNGIVLDPFAGAGTTLLTAQQLGRRSLGIEASEDYIEIAVRRLTR